MEIIKTKYSCAEECIEIFEDYIIINNKHQNQTQTTHILFKHLIYLQLHNYDCSSQLISSIELVMKDNIRLQYLTNNKIYFTCDDECKYVFNKLFTAFKKYQNQKIY